MSGVGFGSLLKPMWLSLIWMKLRPPMGFSAACAELNRAMAVSTPACTVHTTPAPAHAAHFSSPRRVRAGDWGSRFESDIGPPGDRRPYDLAAAVTYSVGNKFVRREVYTRRPCARRE